MTGRDEDAGGDAGTVSLDALPYPVARYAVAGDTIAFDGTNRPFASAFATDASAPTLRSWWRGNGLRAERADRDAVREAILGGERTDATVRADGHAADVSTYRLSVVPDDDPTAGTLTLAPTEPRPESDGGSIGDHIASVVSHDLRNPLDVAKARARAARESGDVEHFDRLDCAHDRMERIIGDVLTLARRDGVVNASPGVEVGDVAGDAWQAVETGVATLAVAGDLPAVEADPDRLQRLFENLFRNAVEHGTASARPADGVEEGPPGAPASSGAASDARVTDADANADDTAVSVRVGPTADGFFVADDGRGVPPAERDRVFEPGYTAAGDGTGLGLTIVDRIATAHGWTVGVAESDGGGARFEITGVE